MTAASTRRSDGIVRWTPWAVLVSLLALCLLQGLRWTDGLVQPADVDQLRDIGFAQAIRDGNWFGDPIYAGEWRWYPPLAHALAAAGLRLSGVFPLTFWMQAGPWVNLLAPLAFFLVTARLFDRRIAAISLLVFVLWSGAPTRPWVGSGYTAWLLAPYLALPLFLGAVGLIHARTEAMRWRDAALIGTALGLVFLAHTVPAIILSGIVTAVAFAERGLAWRSFLWLSVVAAFEIAWGALFIAPLLVHYHLHIANVVPGSYVDGLLIPSRLFTAAAVINLPGVAAAVAAWLLRRRAPMDRRSAAILTAWVAICIVFLLRHYACALIGADGPACQAFVLPVNHFHFYLQTAWACLIGYALYHAIARWIENERSWASRRSGSMAAASILVILAGAGWFLNRPYDRYARAQSQRDGVYFDLAAYRWILANSHPTDLFITDLAAPEKDDPAAISVIAAGRRLVAAPILHSNPYVDWRERDARRRRLLAALTEGATTATPRGDPCDLAGVDGAGAAIWLLLPKSVVPAESLAAPVFDSGHFTIFRLIASPCPALASPHLAVGQ